MPEPCLIGTRDYPIEKWAERIIKNLHNLFTKSNNFFLVAVIRHMRRIKTANISCDWKSCDLNIIPKLV